jgi:hypothetical protein
MGEGVNAANTQILVFANLVLVERRRKVRRRRRVGCLSVCLFVCLFIIYLFISSKPSFRKERLSLSVTTMSIIMRCRGAVRLALGRCRGPVRMV